jgi:MFS family permease
LPTSPQAGLQGRYQALSSMSWDVGGLLGPAIGGVVYSVSPGALWLVFATGALAAGVAAIGAERLLPARVRLTPGPAAT